MYLNISVAPLKSGFWRVEERRTLIRRLVKIDLTFETRVLNTVADQHGYQTYLKTMNQKQVFFI